MDYTPIFRFRIYRMYVKTAERFRADDPWNGGRPSDFAIEDYRVASAGGVPMPAIVSEADRVTRFMPDSLCRLYQDAKVPTATLPQLLRHIEDDLIRSDFLPVLGNAAFYASYLAFVVVSCITVAGTLLVLFQLDAPLLRGVLVMSGLIGVCLLWLHFGYRRKLTRRKLQKKSLLATVLKFERPAPPPAEESAGPVEERGAGGLAAGPKILALSEVEAAVKLTAIEANVPDETLPLFGTAHFYAPPILQNDARPHIEVDDAYHYVVVERGEETLRRSTQNLDDLKYWVFNSSFSQICSRDAARLMTDGTDYRRVWFADQAERLARINPDWRRRWEAEVQEILRRAPYSDLLSLREIEASINRIIATLGIETDDRDLPTYGWRSRDGWYVEVGHLYRLYVQDRGAKYDELRTRNLNDLQYSIVSQLLCRVGQRTRAEYSVPGIDPQRIWDERTADLLRLINPDWSRRWEAKVRETLSKYPYSDGASP